MPIDSRAVAEAPGGGQKDRVTCERSGPVGRSAGDTFHECILIGNLRLQQMFSTSGGTFWSRLFVSDISSTVQEILSVTLRNAFMRSRDPDQRE